MSKQVHYHVWQAVNEGSTLVRLPEPYESYHTAKTRRAQFHARRGGAYSIQQCRQPLTDCEREAAQWLHVPDAGQSTAVSYWRK